jgi:hypothetical protein
LASDRDVRRDKVNTISMAALWLLFALPFWFLAVALIWELRFEATAFLLVIPLLAPGVSLAILSIGAFRRAFSSR